MGRRRKTDEPAAALDSKEDFGDQRQDGDPSTTEYVDCKRRSFCGAERRLNADAADAADHRGNAPVTAQRTRTWPRPGPRHTCSDPQILTLQSFVLLLSGGETYENPGCTAACR